MQLKTISLILYQSINIKSKFKMTLSEQQFKQILEDLPSVEVSLEWEHEEGQGNFQGHEIQSGQFLLFADFNVYETVTIDDGDYFTPPSFTSHGINSDIDAVEVFDNDGEQFTLTEKQSEQLSKAIQSNIQTI